MDPRILKKTQDSLGKIIKKPPLTEKLLSKPPFRFLHDIMTSVIKTTGFMKGLYLDDEMNSENVKDKDSKIAFLQKSVDFVILVTGKSLSVKPGKIVAGHEPEKTNEFLQALASAINKGVDNEEYVAKMLNKDQPEEKKEKSRDDRKKRDSEEKKDREKSAGRDRSRERNRGKEGREKSREGREKSREGRDKEDRHRDKDEKHRDRDEKHKDREDRHRDREERHRDKEERRKDRDKDRDRDKRRRVRILETSDDRLPDHLCSSDDLGDDTGSDFDYIDLNTSVVDVANIEDDYDRLLPKKKRDKPLISPRSPGQSKIARPKRPGAAKPRASRRSRITPIEDDEIQMKEQEVTQKESEVDQTFGKSSGKKRKSGTKSRMANRPNDEEPKVSPEHVQFISRKPSRIPIKDGKKSPGKHIRTVSKGMAEGNSPEKTTPKVKQSLQSPKIGKMSRRKSLEKRLDFSARDDQIDKYKDPKVERDREKVEKVMEKVKSSTPRRKRPKHREDRDEEGKENEPGIVNGEQEKQEEAPTRLARPSSAKGSRRRREGRRHSSDEEDEPPRSMQASDPGMGEDNLPPQVAAARSLARPNSARPAPPRRKQETIENEPAMRLGSGKPTNVIVDNDSESGEEDETFVVEETAQPQTEPDQTVMQRQDDEDEDDHGGLVKKMLETKKELESGSQQQTKKTEIERPKVTDAQKQKQRMQVQKEIDKLRTSIQTLTRSANPLGKVMDYVQEDLDSMQKELERWKTENKEHTLELKRERSITDKAIEPLRAQLSEVDQAIKDQLDLIAAVKSNIMRNDQKIDKMLRSIAKS